MWILAISAVLASEPQCVTAYGETACGYDCTAAYGEIACAQTPHGVCQAQYGEVTCWDPPVVARVEDHQIAEYRGEHRRPELRDDAPPRCVSAYGTTACGFDCTAAYGQVACAATPQGACEAAYGDLKCWDPPTPAPYGFPPAECLAAYGQIACGYGCEAAYGEVTCWDPPRR